MKHKKNHSSHHKKDQPSKAKHLQQAAKSEQPSRAVPQESKATRANSESAIPADSDADLIEASPSALKSDPSSFAAGKKIRQDRGISYMSRGQRRKHIEERLNNMYHRVILLEDELRELDENRFYRCCIFGSARIKPNDKHYEDAKELARLLASRDIDILTGGGPGLMEAANMGAKLGHGESQSRRRSRSYGITIQLEWEPEPNNHIDVKHHHQRFSTRLDEFMRLSHSVVATPGGIGTVLELFFTWQLIQTKHIGERPIVLLGKSFWSGMMTWLQDFPLAQKLISAADMNNISVVDTPKEAFDIIARHHQEFLKVRGQELPPITSKMPVK